MITAVRPPEPALPPAAADTPEIELPRGIDEIINRRPAVGLAVGVVRDGHLPFLQGHGLADIVSNTPITEEMVIRIGSITKLCSPSCGSG